MSLMPVASRVAAAIYGGPVCLSATTNEGRRFAWS